MIKKPPGLTIYQMDDQTYQQGKKNYREGRITHISEGRLPYLHAEIAEFSHPKHTFGKMDYEVRHHMTKVDTNPIMKAIIVL